MLRAYHPYYDRKRVMELFRKNVPDYFASAEELTFQNYLDQFADTYFIVENKHRIIGAGGYHLTDQPGTARLSWQFIDPAFHRMGFGKELTTYLLRVVSAIDNIQIVDVWTSQHAYRFYEKFGFGVKKIKKDYWGKDLDLYVMSMSR